MRSLIVRFIDSEGPGILANILRENGYQITYHNAYHHGLHLIPQAHLVFDLVVLLGGPMSVTDPSLQKFFKPYYELVKGIYSQPDSICIGICLGAQIIAKAFGAEVTKGTNGKEAGYDNLEIIAPQHPLFSGLENRSQLPVFHLHEDTFSLPKGAQLLAKSKLYENQIYSIENRIFGFQPHLEPTWDMIQIWSKVHQKFLEEAGWKFQSSMYTLHKDLEIIGKKVFQNILNMKDQKVIAA